MIFPLRCYPKYFSAAVWPSGFPVIGFTCYNFLLKKGTFNAYLTFLSFSLFPTLAEFNHAGLSHFCFAISALTFIKPTASLICSGLSNRALVAATIGSINSLPIFLGSSVPLSLTILPASINAS